MEVGDRVHRLGGTEIHVVTRVSEFVPMVELNHEGWTWIEGLDVVEPEVPEAVQEQLNFLGL